MPKTLGNIASRFIAIVGVGMDAYAKDRRLVPLNHTVQNSQIAIYWLRLYSRALKSLQESSSLIESDSLIQEEGQSASPTLLGVKEHLDYLQSELQNIVKDLSELIEAQTDPSLSYNLQRAYDKGHESLFNIELAINYYEQLTGR